MTAQFLTELHLTHSSDGLGPKVLDAPLIYHSEVAKKTFTVPAGFSTDLASVPRLPFAYLLFGGVGDAAAVVHDYLYSTQIVSRKMADDVLSEAMRASGIAGWRRFPMWLGVRIFGGTNYDKDEQVTGDPWLDKK